MRPQRLDHLVARQTMPRGQRKQRHQLAGATTRPVVGHGVVVADHDAEPAEQLDANAVVLLFSGQFFSTPSRNLHEERFVNVGPGCSPGSISTTITGETMKATTKADAPVAIEGNGLEFRRASWVAA